MSTHPELHAVIDAAFEHFNAELFDGRLPPVVFLFHRHRKAKGYFWSSRWHKADDAATTRDEIALNPDLLSVRTIEETLSTLVHEMVHLEQEHFGNPPKRAYHNKQWADWMERVGLIPSTTGEPGGKRTGAACTHYIEEDGRFAESCARLLATGFDIPLHSAPVTVADKATAKKKAASKTKYTCGTCGANAWAKPESLLVCGTCMEPMLSRESGK